MGMRKPLLPCLLLGLLLTSACGRKEQTPPAAEPASAEEVATAAAATPAAEGAAADAAAAEAANKKLAIERALAEQKIVDDGAGQWAVSATASSTYAGDKDPAADVAYAPGQASGKPDVERYGDDGKSWASAQADAGIEWLQVEFATPVSARAVRIRQNNAPGAIIKLELIDEAGAPHAIWEGVDVTTYEANLIHWWVRDFAPTPYKAKAARITLATNAVSGWNEIDAVQLVGEPDKAAP